MRRLPPNEKRRIRSETEILAELQHPHIINFYNVWENKEKGALSAMLLLLLCCCCRWGAWLASGWNACGLHCAAVLRC